MDWTHGPPGTTPADARHEQEWPDAAFSAEVGSNVGTTAFGRTNIGLKSNIQPLSRSDIVARGTVNQFLYTTKADGSQGIGIFDRIGFADRNTNILEQFYSFGIAGQGMLLGGDRDWFGLGFYYSRLSNDLPGTFLSGDEMGLEVLYNSAATNWLYVTPDLQVIELVGQRATTAFLTGLRVQMRF